MHYNGPIFLHFLNRELLRSLDIKSLTGVDKILKILTLVTTSKLFAGLGIIIEGEDLLKNGKWILLKLLKNNQIELISDRPTLDESIYVRQLLYESDAKRYKCYFEPSAFTLSLAPTVYKTDSATSVLEGSLTNTLQDENSSLQFVDKFEDKTIEENKENILETIRCREGKGITISLFKDSINRTTEFVLGRALSGLYLNHYTNYVVGDIPTGIERLDYFDRFSSNFPLIDIALYSYIARISSIHLSVDDDFLIHMRGSEIHENFCQSIQHFLYHLYRHCNLQNHFMGYQVCRFRMLGLLRKIESKLPKIQPSKTTDFFFENALERLEILTNSYEKLSEISLQSPILHLSKNTNGSINIESSYQTNASSKIICKNSENGIECGGIMNLEIGPWGNFYVCQKNPKHRYRK